jgi:hypothetical protein
MRYRVIVLAAVAAVAISCSERSGSDSVAEPDLTGKWSRTTPGGAGEQPTIVPGDPHGLKGLKPPLTAWGEAKFNSHKPAMGVRATEHPNDGVTFQCLPPGIPRIYWESGLMEFHQRPGRIVQVWEFNHYFRVIHTDGRGHPDDVNSYPTWMGHSIGHWDGDTLVVETVGFNDRSWLDRVGNPHSESLKVTERIRRADPENINIDITIEDPIAYTKPWTTPQVRFRSNPEAEFIEQICEDKGDYDEVLEELAKPE